MYTILGVSAALFIVAVLTNLSLLFRERYADSNTKGKQSSLRIIGITFNCIACLSATAYYILSQYGIGHEIGIFILFGSWHSGKIVLYILFNFWQRGYCQSAFITSFFCFFAIWISIGMTQDSSQYQMSIICCVLYELLLIFAVTRFGVAARKLVSKLASHMIHLRPIVCRHAICETLRSIHEWSEWKDPVSRFLVHLNKINVLNNWIIASLLGLIIVLIIASFGAISFDMVVLMMELDALIDIICLSLRHRVNRTMYHWLCGAAAMRQDAGARCRCFNIDALCFRCFKKVFNIQQMSKGERENLMGRNVRKLKTVEEALGLVIHGIVNELWRSEGMRTTQGRLPSQEVLGLIGEYSEECKDQSLFAALELSLETL